jgi:hypothetical protein
MTRTWRSAPATTVVVALLAAIPIGADMVLAEAVEGSSSGKKTLSPEPTPPPSPDPPDGGGGGVDPSPSETPPPSETPLPSPSETPTSSPSPSTGPTTSPSPGDDPSPSPSDPTTDGRRTRTPTTILDPVDDREGGSPRTEGVSPTDGPSHPDGSNPPSSPWPFVTVEVEGDETRPLPVGTQQRHDATPALVVIVVLALTVLPFLFFKARQEWRS